MVLLCFTQENDVFLVFNPSYLEGLMVNPFHLVSFPGKKFKLFGFFVIFSRENQPKKV